MKDVTVCVPVLRRYDLLRELLLSLTRSTIVPRVLILDNGRNAAKMHGAVDGVPLDCSIMTPDEPMGLAAAWNTLIAHAQEERVIVNDDVTFAPESLEQMLAIDADFVGCLPGQAFSCFVLRDSCVEKVGLFDIEISPGYAYFEDCDYAERIAQVGARRRDVLCGLTHGGSQTLIGIDPSEHYDHHRKFLLAQENFKKKWGRMPMGVQEQYGA